MPYKRLVQRHCRACKAPQPQSYGVPDPCLGMLEGVLNACCGHGAERCYVHLEDGSVLRGEAARAKQIELGGHPAPFTFTERTGGPMEGWVKNAPNPDD